MQHAPDAAPTPWERVRAGLIALHLFAIVAMAVPSPDGGMNRSAWKDPTVQGEFAAWTGRLNAVGVAVTQPELEEWAWTMAQGWETGRSAVLAPFMPYYRYCGTWQSWRMFVAPHRFPTVLHVDVERAGAWETVFVERSAEHAWRRVQFDHDRMRAAIFRFGWRHYRRSYSRFVDWLALRAEEDFPDATQIRVRFRKFRTASPEEVREGREPEGTFELEMRRPLGARRPVRGSP